MRSYRRLFRNRLLVRLLFGEFVSSIGDWLYMVAILVVVYDVARDPILLGVVGAARILPYALLSVPAGIVADRFDRRLILIVTDVLRGVLMVVLTVLVVVSAPVVAIVAVAILASCVAAFFGPAIAAYLPTVVQDETDLGPANSAWATLDNLAFMIGPGVAGMMIAAGGLQTAFILNALSFGVIALVLLTLPPSRRVVTQTAPGGETIREETRPASTSLPGGDRAENGGWRRLASLIPGPLVLDAATSIAGGGLGVLTVIIAIDLLGAGDEATGYLNAATGVGGVIAGVIAGGLTMRRLDVPLVLGALVGSVGLAILGLTRDLPAALVAIGVAVGALLLLDIVNVTLIQRAVPDELRGRAMGLLQTTGTIAMVLGSFLLPIIASIVGLAPVLVLTGLLTGAVALLAVFLLARRGVLAAPVVDPGRVRILDSSVFAGLPPARLEAAARRMLPVDVPPGEVVIRQGDAPDRFYLIESGSYAVTQAGEGEPARVLRRLGPGDAFGEIGLLRSAPRTATVTAETGGRLFALDRDAFLELVDSGPGLSTRLLDLYRGGRGATIARGADAGVG